MKKLLILCSFLVSIQMGWSQQSPCSTDSMYRQFDFWLGNWEAFSLKGQKSGDSKITSILDKCIILEEWTSASSQNGLTYSGKSFNTYNTASKQWQQTWVDNVGGTNEYLQGEYKDNKMVFISNPFAVSKETMAIRRLSFFNLGSQKVRQLGEISKDNGVTWAVEYDLEYRRK